jgi:hypothetical protein
MPVPCSQACWLLAEQRRAAARTRAPHRQLHCIACGRASGVTGWLYDDHAMCHWPAPPAPGRQCTVWRCDPFPACVQGRWGPWHMAYSRMSALSDSIRASDTWRVAAIPLQLRIRTPAPQPGGVWPSGCTGHHAHGSGARTLPAVQQTLLLSRRPCQIAQHAHRAKHLMQRTLSPYSMQSRRPRHSLITPAGRIHGKFTCSI